MKAILRLALGLAAALAPLAAAGAEEAPGFLGVVVTREAVDVASEVTGRLESVEVRGGDRVRQGEVLARLDTSLLAQDLAMARSSLTAAEAEVTRSRAQLAEAETRHRRRAALPDTFSKEEIAAATMEKDTAAATAEAAEARAAEQKVRVEQLASSIERAEIRAPFGGTVALRYLDPGATVLAGSPVVRLLNTEEMLVRFAVPPERVEELALGQRVEIRIEDAGLLLTGIIRHVAPEIDAPSQMVFVEARPEVPEGQAGRLRTGLVARVVPLAG